MSSLCERLVCIATGIFLGVAGCVAYYTFTASATAIVAVPLGQFLQVFVSVFAGSVLSLWVHRRATAHDRLRDISVRVLESIETRLAAAYETASDYMRTPVKNKEPAVNTTLKSLSVFISLLDKVDTRKTGVDLKNTLEFLKTEFLKFKASITGGTFGSKNNKVSETQVAEMESSYSAMSRQLLEAKLQVYLR